jgi:tetratricopeptide (TPR) repeat protein
VGEAGAAGAAGLEGAMGAAGAVGAGAEGAVGEGAEGAEGAGAEGAAGGSVQTPFHRRVSVLLALVALLGGLAGFAANDAGARRSSTVREAQRASVTAMAQQQEVSNKINEEMGNYVESSTVRRKRDISIASDELLGNAAAGATAWRQAADKINDVSRLLQPGTMAGRPDLLWSELWVPADEATLRQQALQATANDWDDKSDQHTGVATLLAIALTLLGLSLTVSPGTRLFLVWPGLVVAILGVVGGLVVVFRPVAATPDAAIRAVAEGNRRQNSRDFEGAVAAYREAITLDPDNAVAFRNRGTAVVLADSPERDNSTFVFSSSSAKARRASVADLRHALELGGEDYLALVNLSADYFHLRDYPRTEEYSRRAIKLNDALPTPWLNLLLSFVARGDEKQSVVTAGNVIDRIVRRPLVYERRELFGSMRATLETVVQREPERAALAARLQDLAVQAQMRMEQPDAPANPDGTVTDLKLTSLGAQLFAEMNPQGLTEGTRLSLIAYYRADGEPEWSEVSGQSAFLTWTSAGRRPGTPYSFPLYLAGCRVAGRHRVDVYVDGRRVASQTVAQQGSALQLRQFFDVASGLALCQPTTWTLEQGVSGSADLVSADNRYHLSLRLLPLSAPPATVAARKKLTDQVLDRLTRQLMPGGPAPGDDIAWSIGRLPGAGRVLTVSDTEGAHVWVGLTDGGNLCAMIARYPRGNLGDIDPLLRYVLFQ